jgi:hypothetical protein
MGGFVYKTYPSEASVSDYSKSIYFAHLTFSDCHPNPQLRNVRYADKKAGRAKGARQVLSVCPWGQRRRVKERQTIN